MRRKITNPEENVNIAILLRTRLRLQELASKGESYDAAINRLLDETMQKRRE